MITEAGELHAIKMDAPVTVVNGIALVTSWKLPCATCCIAISVSSMAKIIFKDTELFIAFEPLVWVSRVSVILVTFSVSKTLFD